MVIHGDFRCFSLPVQDEHGKYIFERNQQQAGLFHQLLSLYNMLLVGGLAFFIFFHILGSSSSQLTFLFFRGGGSTTKQVWCCCFLLVFGRMQWR